MKAVILDDEYYAIEGLKMELLDSGLAEVAGTYEDGRLMLTEIEEIDPDIIFLDIEMPDLNGFDVYEKLIEKGMEKKVVFTTAYSNYAVQAFEINATDYILKPVTRERLVNTISRFNAVNQAAANELRLQINCFKHFDIMAGDKNINSKWRTKKAEELIAYLICAQGAYVAKERIAEDLWPGLDSRKSMANLYLAYYYMKRKENEMGVTIPIESERGKMRFCLNDIDCDVYRFEKLIARSDERLPVHEQIELIEAAIGVYKGSIFEDCYYSWATECQQKYEIMYYELLKRLIEYYKDKDQVKMKYFETKLV